jgi:hypothetical protein
MDFSFDRRAFKSFLGDSLFACISLLTGDNTDEKAGLRWQLFLPLFLSGISASFLSLGGLSVTEDFVNHRLRAASYAMLSKQRHALATR